MTTNQKDRGGKSLGIFMIGAAIGSITALLFAPKSGKETRADIKSKAETARDKAAQAGHTVADKTTSLAGKARDTVARKSDQAADKVQSTTDKAKRKL